MTPDQEPIEEGLPQPHLDPGGALLGLFEKITLRERIAKIRYGIKQPKETGDYKWALFELKRFMSPVAAVVVPVLALLMLVAFAALNPPPDRTYTVEMIDPESIPDLEKIEDLIELPQDIQPVDVDFTQDTVVTDITPLTDFSPQPTEVDAVAITRSPVVMRGIYGSRNPGNRGTALARYGGLGTEVTVLRALRWLKTIQNTDGSWNETKPAMTSLAILTYLAHGDTTASEEFGETVERALRFLIGAQGADGRFRGRDRHDYTLPIAAYALAEAYGMIGTPELKEAAEKAIDLIIKGQNASGSFDYNLRPGGSDRNDTTYASWCVQALKAASIARLQNEGIEDTMKKAIPGIKLNYGESGGFGGFGYTERGRGNLSGAGVLCLQFLGDTRSAEYRNAMSGLIGKNFDWEGSTSSSPVYYWYYETQVFFQHGGDAWADWNRKFSPTLVKTQTVIQKEQSGYVDHKGRPQETGYWDSPSPTEYTGGAGNRRVMSTILCTQMLEVYYRFLPTFQAMDIAKEVDIAEDTENIDVSIRF